MSALLSLIWSPSGYRISLLVFMTSAAFVFFILLFSGIKAPYGKFTSNIWGRASINAQLGWMLMEGFSSIIFIVYILHAALNGTLTVCAVAFFCFWQFHYAYRSFVYPFVTPHSKKMPLGMMFSGLAFQVTNSFFQARWVFDFGLDSYSASWLLGARFVVGAVFFIAGSVINRHSDAILRSLRKDGNAGYSVPYGGLFTLVSSPNYLGELLVWLGWAVMLWSLPGFAFFAWTAANLVPRALSNHAWYRCEFSSYPKKRRALIPFIL